MTLLETRHEKEDTWGKFTKNISWYSDGLFQIVHPAGWTVPPAAVFSLSVSEQSLHGQHLLRQKLQLELLLRQRRSSDWISLVRSFIDKIRKC